MARKPKSTDANVSEANGLRILNLRVENFQRIEVADITPREDVIEITGANGQGKSSALDAIEALFAGKAALKPRPVRDGADEARLLADLGTLRIEAHVAPDRSTRLVVRGADGARYSSPQAVLDELRGKVGFDPLAFDRLKPKEQIAALLSVTEIEADLEALERSRTALFERRTERGRDLKSAAAAVQRYADIPAETPDEPLSAEQIVNECRALEARKAERTRMISALDDTRGRWQRTREQIAQLEQQLERMRQELATLEKAGNELHQRIKDTPEIDDAAIEALTSQLDWISVINAQVERKAQRKRLIAERDAIERDVQGLSDELDEIDARKRAALAAAKFPIPGLGYDDEGVTFQGRPLANASDAERLRVCIGIAMALNPHLRVLCVRDGSLLDQRSLGIVREMAADRGYQVWIERVDESGSVGVVFENGRTVER